MAIPERYQNRCVYHFTHIDNLPGILEYGLLSTNEKSRLGINHMAIAYTDIQERRSCMDVPCGCGGVVHDYVPLYFCKRSSMLLAVVNGKIADQQLIIYFEFPINIINHYPWVMTDASANTGIPPNFYEDETCLDNLKWTLIDSLKWAMPSDKAKQARQAELLIHKKIDISSVSKIIVWNESVKDIVIRAFADAKLQPPPVVCDEFFYYVDFYDSGSKSIVTGPLFTKKAYLETITALLSNIGKTPSARFQYLFFLLKYGFEVDFGCIPETRELIGLETDNAAHSEDVGTHTLSVVQQLLKLPDYKTLDKVDKMLVEVAAYLHDIGKGPKSRWADNGGRQKIDPDHPIKALPMLNRILTEEVVTMKPRSAKVICKLVCYHDLIGDILGKSRRIEELIDIVEDERELNMLIALSKADILAINDMWMDEEKIDSIRKQVIKAIKTKSEK